MNKQLYTKTIRRLLTAATLIAVLAGAQAQTTNTIVFQGRVTASGGSAPADGVYRMSFTLLNADTLGDTLWTETDFNVPVSGGLFTHQLGSVNPFPQGLFGDEPNLFLEIAIDVNNNGLDAGDIQTPRTPLNAAPVALHAKDAAMLGGVSAEDIPTSTEVTAEILALESTLNDTLTNSQAAQNDVINSKADAADLEKKLDRNGAAYVVVTVVDDAALNGANLLQAYEEVKTLTPQGAVLSATNRAVLVVPPGLYDLGTEQLTLDTEFVDLIGLTTDNAAQYIYGTANGPGTGVIRQTADNVRIENLYVECNPVSGGVSFNSSDPAAYFPDSALTNTVVKNCGFKGNATNENSAFAWGTRIAINYSGTYVDITGDFRLFGAGTASGTFIRCTGGTSSFATGGTASGIFRDCTATGESFARSGTASGFFINCKAGNNSFGAFGTASGSFTNCEAGSTSFGGGTTGNAGTASGVFVDCIAGSNSFGGGSGGTSLGARLTRCEMIGANWVATFRGRMEDCRWFSTAGVGSLTLGQEARIYNSTFVGTVNLNNTAAGLTQSRARSITNAGSNVFGATNAAAFNIVSAEVQ